MADKNALTKKDINLLLEAFKSVFVTKTEFENFKMELDEKLKGLPTKDEFYKAMDELMGEIKTS